MIKFFRKIRQNLLSEGKTGKYFKYAIGEIVLVVIGILIALQINNWNENRKQESKSKHLIDRLKIENQENIESIKLRIESAHKSNQDLGSLLLLFGEKINESQYPKIDSLFLNISPDYHLGLNLNTLKEGRENGEISLIKNDSLRANLYQLVSITDNINEFEKITNNDNNNFMMPFLYKNSNRRNVHARAWELHKNKIGPSKLDNNDYSLLFQNRELENLVNARFNYSEGMVFVYQDLEKFLHNLSQKLEQGSN